jgi:hypothetical protein
MQTGVKRNTKRIGDISELRVMHDLVRAVILSRSPSAKTIAAIWSSRRTASSKVFR